MYSVPPFIILSLILVLFNSDPPPPPPPPPPSVQLARQAPHPRLLGIHLRLHVDQMSPNVWRGPWLPTALEHLPILLCFTSSNQDSVSIFSKTKTKTKTMTMTKTKAKTLEHLPIHQSLSALLLSDSSNQDSVFIFSLAEFAGFKVYGGT